MKIVIHMGDPFYSEMPNAKRMKTFYEEFKKSGHDVYILSPGTEYWISENKNVICCRTIPLKKKTTLNRLMNQCFFGVSSVMQGWKIKNADVVITTSPPALISPFGWIIAKRLRAKLVYDVRDIWPDVAWEMEGFSKNSFYSRIFSFIRDFMLKHADLITTVSAGKVKKLQRYCPEGKVVLISNGLDETFLDNSENLELINEFHLKEKFTCVYVGNIGLAQRLEQMLYLAEQAKMKKYDAQFLIFGSGVEEKKIRQYILKHELDNVFFQGRISGDKIYTILKNSDMSFVSLVNENLRDSVPTKMFEALGVGCPVLLAACGDATDILMETELGIAVKPNDKEALMYAFETIYQGLTDLSEKRNKARILMTSKYSRQKAAIQMEQLLREQFATKG